MRVHVNGARIIDEWHGATGATYTSDFTLPTGTHNFMVEYYEASGQAFLNYELTLVSSNITVPQPTATPVVGTSPGIGLPGNWLATYYNNRSLAGNAVGHSLRTQPQSRLDAGFARAQHRR